MNNPDNKDIACEYYMFEANDTHVPSGIPDEYYQYYLEKVVTWEQSSVSLSN